MSEMPLDSSWKVMSPQDRAADNYYPPFGWVDRMANYSLNRDVWGTCFAPTTRSRTRIGHGLLAPWLNDGGMIVDIGSGPGLHSAGLVSAAHPSIRELIAIDVSLTALRMAADRIGQTRHRIRYSQSDATRLPIRDTCADVVICAEVLEHVSDDHRAMAEIHRILKPGGIVYVSVPIERRVSTPWHVRRYDDAALRSLLRSVGFGLLAVRRSGTVTPKLWQLLRYPIWLAWLTLTGNLMKQLRRDVVPSFYASPFCQRFVVPVFDLMSHIDEWVGRAGKARIGNTLHCVARKAI